MTKLSVDTVIYFESIDSFEEGMSVALTKGNGIIVAVAEEQAVGSYNQSFECHSTLSNKQAIKLRDWLNNVICER